jgi:hypothetical protein
VPEGDTTDSAKEEDKVGAREVSVGDREETNLVLEKEAQTVP